MTQKKFNVVTRSHQHYGGEPLSDFPEKEINLAEMNEALLEISFAINSHLELPVILEQVVAFTCKKLGFCDGSILLWDARQRQFQDGASTTRVGKSVAKRVRKKNGASSWVVTEKRSLIISDVAYEPFTANKMIAENKIKAYAGIPILNDGEVYGVLYALSHHVNPFSKSIIEVLEKLASLAASALKNAQLIKSLKELNDFKTGMMRLAVHDLIEPLSLMIGFSEMMFDDMAPISPMQAHRMAVIKRSQCRMNELISGMIKYESLTEDSCGGEKSHVNLGEIAELVVQNLKDLAAEKSQDLYVESHLADSYVLGDPFLLHEALTNLVSNGIKYTPKYGEIKITVEQEDETYLLTVEDTGPGIEPDELEEIFDPFFRVESKELEKGAGLGLSLVRLIVERHRGSVSVESMAGSGSKFMIQLPIDTKMKSDLKPKRICDSDVSNMLVALS